MHNEAMPQPERIPNPQPPEVHEKPVWNATAPTWEERDQHAKEIAALEAKKREILAIAESRLKRIGAMFTGHPKDGELERIYEQLRKLREDSRFKEDNSFKGNSPTIH